MKSFLNKITQLLLVMFLVLGAEMNIKAETNGFSQRGNCQKGQKGNKPCNLQSDSASASTCAFEGTITDAEAEGLQFMYEEEKMARDVYDYLYQKFELRVFGNITKSEQKHMSAVAGLMKGASITNNGKSEAGEFSIKEIQDLYDQLISKGELSIKDALEVGVLIEEKDIKDLETEIANASNESIKTVYSNLLSASNRHLQAFNRNLERR